MPSFARQLLHFLQSFPLPPALPPGVAAESPFREPAVYALLSEFAHTFYAAAPPRVAVLGMGRTGMAFTDPTALTEFCGTAQMFTGTVSVLI